MSTQSSLIGMSKSEVMSEKSKRLDDEERKFKSHFRGQVEALTAILDGELYSVYGFSNIVEYAAVRLDVGKSRVYQLLDCGYVFKALGENSTIVEKLTHEGLLRPLAGMATESKVKVLQAAVKEAKDGALTGPFIQDLARERFNWKSRKEFKASNKPDSVKQQEAFEAFAGKSQRLMGALIELGIPTQLVEAYGPPKAWGPLWEHFVEWFEELKELS